MIMRASIVAAVLFACAHEPEVQASPSSVAIEVGPGAVRASLNGWDVDAKTVLARVHELTVEYLKKRSRYPIVEPQAGVAPPPRSFYVDPVVTELTMSATSLHCAVEVTLSRQPKLVPFATATASATVPDANVKGMDAVRECLRAAIDGVVTNQVVPRLKKKVDSRD
jgi:hypothetical protein